MKAVYVLIAALVAVPGAEGGMRHHTDLTEIEGLAGTGLENLADAGHRRSMPMSGVVRLGFSAR